MTIISFIAINFGAIYRTTKSSYRDSPSHMIGKVVTGCVAILPYHTATQDRGSECRDFGFISRIVTALLHT